MEITPALIAKKLNAAADLLETKGWTKGEMARTERGNECKVDSRRASCFCLYGAIARVSGDAVFEVNKAVDRFLGSDIDGVIWNDSRKSAEPVIAALRGAAKQVLADAA